jgi:hypothetical protein
MMVVVVMTVMTVMIVVIAIMVMIVVPIPSSPVAMPIVIVIRHPHAAGQPGQQNPATRHDACTGNHLSSGHSFTTPFFTNAQTFHGRKCCIDLLKKEQYSLFQDLYHSLSCFRGVLPNKHWQCGRRRKLEESIGRPAWPRWIDMLPHGFMA